MKKISICITNDIIYDRRILRCCETLSASYDVKVYCRRLHKASHESEKYEVKRINCLFNKGFLFYAEYNVRLLILLLVNKTDAIVGVDFDTLLAVSYAGAIKNTRRVFDAHEYFEESVELIDRPRVKRFWERIGRKHIPKFDLAYTVSDAIAEIYHEKFGLEFATIRNLPYSSSSLEKPNVSKQIILYQGVLNVGRKLEILIDSSEYLDSSFEIWILGEGDKAAELKKMASAIRSECKVKFFSWIHPDQLSEYTSKASLAYNLLENRSKSYYYSLANKFFDYIHHGIPSLNSPFPEYTKINERYDCCFIIEENDGKSLAEKVIDIHSSKKLLSRKKENAFKAAKDLSWEMESPKLLSLYKSLEKKV